MMDKTNRRRFLQLSAMGSIGAGISGNAIASFLPSFNTVAHPGKVGMIGLDTSHCEAFTKVLNNPDATVEYSGFPVTVAYPYGSKKIKSSADRIPQVTENMKKLGVRIAGSIDELLKEVDMVLLETNDGTLHLEQALQVINAGKPLFIDKPVAASFRDTVAIYKAAKERKVPLFSSSSLRFTPAIQELAKGKIGKLVGADTFTPCHFEPSHADLYWYGIHGVETLYTLLGTGCRQVMRASQENADVVVGTWSDGRIGTFRGLRAGKEDYGATAYGENDIAKVAAYAGYEPLVKEIVQFFKSGKPPVSAEETIEIYAFMEAADESKRQGGKPVSIDSVMNKVNKK